MPPKADVQQFLDLVAQLGDRDPSEGTPEEAREAYRMLNQQVVGPEVASVEDRTIEGLAGPIPLRIYSPGAGEEGAAARPVLVWFHGGGFVIGDLDTADPTARALAARSDAVVVSVDYRLAPEHRFPAAVDDAMVAVQWVAEHAPEIGGDGRRLAVGGHSAGANLAAVVSQLAKAAGGPELRLQILACPAVDLAGDYASAHENAEGYFVTTATMIWFAEHYLAGHDPETPRVSPLLASDLSGLPPALVITAEYDPLRDQGDAYAAALSAAGVDVEHHRYDGQIHDFYTLAGLVSDADQALDVMAGALRRALS